MKKFIVGFPMLVLSVISHSQPTTAPSPEFKTDYLAKSKKQKTAAWILIGSGAVLIATGALIPHGEYTSSGNIWDDIWGGGTYKNESIKSAFEVTGYLTMLGSIPLFVASGNNRKKGMSLSFKNESTPMVLKGSWVNRAVPSINLKLNL